MKKFGELLKEARINKGMTQGKLGAMTNCDHSYISNLERGKKTPPIYTDTVERMQKILGFKNNELVEAAKHDRRVSILQVILSNGQQLKKIEKETIGGYEIEYDCKISKDKKLPKGCDLKKGDIVRVYRKKDYFEEAVFKDIEWDNWEGGRTTGRIKGNGQRTINIFEIIKHSDDVFIMTSTLPDIKDYPLRRPQDWTFKTLEQAKKVAEINYRNWLRRLLKPE